MFEVHNKQFKTKKSLGDYTRDLLNRNGCCKSLKTLNEDDWRFLINLCIRHPNHDKWCDIEDFSIQFDKFNKSYLCFYIITSKGRKESISIKKCVNGVDDENKLSRDMRNSIECQIIDFKNNNKLVCSKCFIHCENLDVDHKHPKTFKNIRDKFLKTTKLNIPKQFSKGLNSTTVFSEDDDDFEDEWCSFHMKEAKLRYLCKPCHVDVTKKYQKV